MPQNMTITACLIALDWGTSRLRAYLLGAQGQIIEQRAASLGILKIPAGEFDATFEQACAPWFDSHGPLPVLLSGMIGSRQGWVEAAYAKCPAGLDETAANLLRFASARQRQINVVPGLSFESDAGVPDVMRGEETQIFGALEDASAGVFVLPGTHSKWARVEAGKVESFATFMTGELFSLLLEHSILGRTVEGRGHDTSAFRRGCEYGAQSEDGAGLLHAIFSARTLALFERIAPAHRAAYLSGVLIGAEVHGALRWIGAQARDITLIGEAALCDLYLEAAHTLGARARIAASNVTARGLWRIARAAALA
jgi:2-dehydro-3-deoxygalactonokinase